MFHSMDIFGPGSNMKHRFIPDHEVLCQIISSLRQVRRDLQIVMTLGAYDLLHIGHSRYLEQAKDCGAVVIVGIDCDEAIKARKGPRRPIIPENERIEMLCHLRHVDLVTIDSDYHKSGERVGHTKLSLVKAIKPDVFIASERSYDDNHYAILNECCGQVVTLPSQAETSTSAKLRLFVMEVGAETKLAIDDRIRQELPEEPANLFSQQFRQLMMSLGEVAKDAVDEQLKELKP